MTFTSLQKRTTTVNKRPVPTDLGVGQLGVNYNNQSPGLFFKTTTDAMVKVGPVAVSSGQPTILSGQSNCIGELWFDTDDSRLYCWTGTQWVAVRAEDPA